jgi:peptidoglycan-associated lipoprotein
MCSNILKHSTVEAYMRRIATGVGIVFAAAWFTACPPTYPNCKSDEACKDHPGEVCVQGQCQECAVDANCKAGFVCQTNKCVPKPECTQDAACGTGKKCDAGKCVTHECEQDTDCKGGASCQAHACVKAPGACAANEDCQGGESCEKGHCATGKGKSSCDLQPPVLFGFNDASVPADARSHLADVAECIKSSGSKLRLEGHADERGTEEYNLHLSQRRAAAVKKYLVDLGIPAAKLDAVGYGENRPANPGHDEAAWAENRRVELKK